MSRFTDIACESVQTYWNARPCNVRHSKKELGTKEYFDEVEARKYLVEPHIPAFAEFARWKGKKVLEIGCGIGTDTINFARAGAIVTAVDYSDASIAIAKKRAAVFGCDIAFYCGNAEELSSFVPAETYDLVYSFGVIHHTPHPERVIEEIKKYMDARSVFKIMVYHTLSWKVLWILLHYRHGNVFDVANAVARYAEAQEGCPVVYTYTRKSVRALLAGYVLESVFVDHVFPYRISKYKQGMHEKVWYFGWMPKGLFRAFERAFGWHLCVTCRLDAKGAAAR
jgi:2-polyprenyl-3-methyl-5-hydroxy-6-metoxy-1,4-benzoquinol methylase